MARPRTPSNVLELRGAFKHDPQRSRTDAEGAGPFCGDPPTDLPANAVRAWRQIVERLPRIAITSSDELALAQAARCLAGIWELDTQGGAMHPAFKALNAALKDWLVQLGMTPVARTKIPAHKAEKSSNPFGDI